MAKKDESGGDRHGPRQRYGRILDQLCGIAHVDQIGGHTAEHRTDPLRVFAVGLARPMDLATGPFVLTHIVLRQHVAAELGREIEGRQREERSTATAAGKNFLNRVVIAAIVRRFKGTKSRAQKQAAT